MNSHEDDLILLTDVLEFKNIRGSCPFSNLESLEEFCRQRGGGVCSSVADFNNKAQQLYNRFLTNSRKGENVLIGMDSFEKGVFYLSQRIWGKQLVDPGLVQEQQHVLVDDDPTSIFLPNVESSFFEVQKTPSRFRASTRHINKTIWDQQNEGICLAVSSTDAATTILRMTGPDKKLLLSPQSLVDYRCKKFSTVRYFLTNKNFGIEKLTDQPFHLTKRLRSCYHPHGQRFTMDGAKILKTSRDIRRAIVANFGPFGPQYPMVGSCKMGHLWESKVAADCFMGVPFSHNYMLEGYLETLEEEGGHAVTISGCNTQSKDPGEHYVEIKNSWGRDWGVGGYTNVRFGFLTSILSFNPI